MKKLIAVLSLILCLCLTVPACADVSAAPGNPEVIPEGLEIDWEARYTYAELEAQMQAIADAYPDITKLYEIGNTWRERSLWCMEITNENIAKENKTGISVLGNIHGGERESASSAMYFMWWMALNSENEYVKNLLDNYVVYVVPVINPDGYEQSFVINTRQNMRPRDLNGNGTPFSDPYSDLDGDGYIAYLIAGNADDDMSGLLNGGSIYQYMSAYKYLGRESADWDKNGVLADDPRNSGIDLNRTFDYQWNRYDIETRNSETGVIGTNSFSSAGPDAASEPEVKAVQNFLIKNDIDALVTLHTGIQCVLYPWCYRPFDETVDGDDILFMKETAEKMAAAFQNTTGRGFYTCSSYEDYPTSAELIDYAYGRLNIHAYTIEVYCPGKSSTGDISECCWENELPAPTLNYYTAEEVTAMGLDLSKFDLGGAEGVWFYTASTDQMVDKAPEGQSIMVQGLKDAVLTMMESEPYGEGWTVPYYLQ